MQTRENGTAAHPDPEPTKRKMRSENLSDELLPGLPNDITLDIIAPKLSCKEIHVLSKASPHWSKAVTGHLVYDARVRHRTETLVVVAKCHGICGPEDVCGSIAYFSNDSLYSKREQTLALFSKRDQSVHELPRIPGFRTGFPYHFQWATLDGKIYLLGGTETQCGQFSRACSEVYVLDVAGQRQWQQCASMKSARYGFNTAVIGGKIYVYGGMSGVQQVRGYDEVYDPKLDVWSPIKGSPFIKLRPSVSFRHGNLIWRRGYCLGPTPCTIKL